MIRLLPLLVLPACLLAQERPCACPGDLACDAFGECPTYCTFQDDCLDGFACDDGTCVPAACERNQDCGTGEVCDDTFGEPTCRVPCDPFASDPSCPWGQECFAGLCVD